MTKLLYSMDTREFPGKVRLRFVEFTEEIVPMDATFEGRSFELVDRQHTHVAEFLRTQLGNRAQRRKR